MSKLKPLSDTVIVDIYDKDVCKEDSYDGYTYYGIVLAVGPGDTYMGVQNPMPLKEGDIVLTTRKGTKLVFEGKEYYEYSLYDIVATVESDRWVYYL